LTEIARFSFFKKNGFFFGFPVICRCCGLLCPCLQTRRRERIKTEKGGGRIQRRQMEKTGVLYRSLSFFLSSVILESELLFIYLCLFGKWGKIKWKRS